MSEYEKADWSIPHCKHVPTANGFTTSSRNMKGINAQLIGGIAVIAAFFAAVLIGVMVGSILGSAIGFVSFIASCVFFYWRINQWLYTTTFIEVTPDAVIINGKRLRREDFGGIVVASSLGPAHSILGYQYGHTTTDLEGLWENRKATEFASAFSQYFRATPNSAAQSQPSPDQLRAAAQATDF